MGFFDDDISWCYDSIEDADDRCDNIKCFRHISNRKPQPRPDIFTLAALKGTIDCPYYEEGDE